PGFKVGDDLWTDPHVAYRTGEKGRLPMRPREDRQIWRDTGPLLLLREGDYTSDRGHVRFSRPVIVDQLRLLQRERYLSPSHRETFEVYGMRSDKAKVFEWQYERLTLPERGRPQLRGGAAGSGGHGHGGLRSLHPRTRGEEGVPAAGGRQRPSAGARA
ncbi:CRISPR-associated protein Cse1, partial [mine drainage metagenome]